MSKIAVEAVRLWVKAYSDYLARLYKLLLFGHLYISWLSLTKQGSEILSNVVDGCERIRENYAAVLSSPSWNLTPSITREMSL